MIVLLFNSGGELEAEINTVSLATFLEFAQDFRDANGFVCLQKIAPDCWTVHEPTRADSNKLQEQAHAS